MSEVEKPKTALMVEFTGGAASGKSTLIAHVSAQLQREGIPVSDYYTNKPFTIKGRFKALKVVRSVLCSSHRLRLLRLFVLNRQGTERFRMILNAFNVAQHVAAQTGVFFNDQRNAYDKLKRVYNGLPLERFTRMAPLLPFPELVFQLHPSRAVQIERQALRTKDELKQFKDEPVRDRYMQQRAAVLLQAGFNRERVHGALSALGAKARPQLTDQDAINAILAEAQGLSENQNGMEAAQCEVAKEYDAPDTADSQYDRILENHAGVEIHRLTNDESLEDTVRYVAEIVADRYRSLSGGARQ